MTGRYPAHMQRPRVGFVGVGWIGRHRLAAIVASQAADVAAITDPSHANRREALLVAPDAAVAPSFEALLDLDLDGIVIATPSALHASQAAAALARGLAVFCQKPLARTGDETAQVIDAAKRANRLLHVDLSYRHMSGAIALRDLVRAGGIGEVFSADLVFHNAYGPDKPWCFDRRQSGGGCLIDLGVHLVDLAFWILDFPAVTHVTSRLFAGGRLFDGAGDRVEDFVTARVDLATGAAVNLACSWRLPIGRDADIHAVFHGTAGGAAVHNVQGSFYDFRAERFRGTCREVLVDGPDEWGGRAAVAWARRLAQDRRFDPNAERLIDVARTLDHIYAPQHGTTPPGNNTGATHACAS